LIKFQSQCHWKLNQRFSFLTSRVQLGISVTDADAANVDVNDPAAVAAYMVANSGDAGQVSSPYRPTASNVSH